MRTEWEKKNCWWITGVTISDTTSIFTSWFLDLWFLSVEDMAPNIKCWLRTCAVSWRTLTCKYLIRRIQWWYLAYLLIHWYIMSWTMSAFWTTRNMVINCFESNQTGLEPISESPESIQKTHSYDSATLGTKICIS